MQYENIPILLEVGPPMGTNSLKIISINIAVVLTELEAIKDLLNYVTNF